MNRSIRDLLRDYKEVAAPLRAPPAPSKFPSRKTDKNHDRAQSLYNYFSRGVKNFTTPDGFLKQWQRLPHFVFTGTELVDMIQGAKQCLKSKDISFEKNKFVRIMADHWALWEEPMLGKLNGLQPKELSAAILAPATLRILPGEAYLHSWFTAATNKISSFKPHDLSSSLYACAVLRKSPPNDFLTEWMTAFEKSSHNFTSQNLSNSLWAAAALHAKTGNPLFESLFAMVSDRLEERQPLILEVPAQKQIHDSYLWFDRDRITENPMQSEKESRYERDILTRLRIIRYNVDGHIHPIPILRQAIDFTLNTGKKRVHFEVDGPSHFLFSTQSDRHIMDGKTLFRSALCRKLAPHDTIVRLHFAVMDDWLTANAAYQRRMLDSILKEVSAMGAGAYKVKYHGSTVVVDPMLIETSPRFLQRAQSLQQPNFA